MYLLCVFCRIEFQILIYRNVSPKRSNLLSHRGLLSKGLMFVLCTQQSQVQIYLLEKTILFYRTYHSNIERCHCTRMKKIISKLDEEDNCPN